jgi:RNA polymerase sigma-70 factor (ECF subfamily)
VDQRGLVERAQRGDHDAFAVLAGAAVARLDAAARLILRDPELARDAVQEALVRTWRDLPTLRDAERFDAWVHRLLVNACLDMVRRRKRRAVEVELTPLFTPSAIDFSGGVVDRDQLDRALRALEPRWRAIVVLHYYLGIPLPEVAADLGIPLGTAKSRLHRAMSVLRSTVAAESADVTVVPVPEGQLA